MKTAACRVFFACLVLTGVAPAGAQPPDFRTDARVHAGPLYFTPDAVLKELGVDTNVFNSADPKSDFTATLGPTLDLWVPFRRRALITAGGGADLVYFKTYASERSVNPRASLRFEGFLGRINPFIEGSYLSTRQRPDYEIDARSRREEQSVRAGVNVRVSAKLSLEIAARDSTLAYGSDATFNNVSLRETMNRHSQNVALTVRHDLTPLTTILVRADGGNDRFEFSPQRDSDSFRVMPGVEFKPRALISGTGSMGFRRFNPLSADLPGFTGLVANGALIYTFRGSLRLLFEADRDVTYSYERLQPYFVVTGLGLTVRRQLVGRVDVIVGGRRRVYTYRDVVLPGVVPVDVGRVDHTKTWSGTVGYRFGEMRLGLGTIYVARDSNSVRFRDYDGFKFITTFDYGL